MFSNKCTSYIIIISIAIIRCVPNDTINVFPVGPKVLRKPPPGPQLVPIVLDGVSCDGGESSLGNCPNFGLIDDCTHQDDAGANCTVFIGKLLLFPCILNRYYIPITCACKVYYML